MREGLPLRDIVSVLAKLGGGVVVFYALGFTVLQCFVTGAEVEGMFWFSRQYYEEAGGKFIVEMIRTPLLKPSFFLLYLLLLLYLVPAERNMDEFLSSKEDFIKKIYSFTMKQQRKVLFLLSIALVTYLFAGYFKAIMGSSLVNEYIMPAFLWPGRASVEQGHSLLFFTLTVPVAVALGVFLLRFRRHREENLRLYNIALTLYIIFVAILPISYGRYIYDMKAIPINNPVRMYTQAGLQRDMPASAKLWLLGRFGGKYLFLRIENFITDVGTPIEQVSLGRPQGIVEALDEEQVKHLNFTLERADSLRNLMKSSKGSTFENKAFTVFEGMFEQERSE